MAEKHVKTEHSVEAKGTLTVPTEVIISHVNEKPIVIDPNAKLDSTDLAPVEMLPDFEAMAGFGLEKVTSKDILIPRITIIQALSDQLKRTNSSFIADAQIGDIIDVATNEIMPKPMIFLPVIYDKVWIEWYPRNTKKGIANIHKTAEILEKCKLDAKQRSYLDNGNLVAETAQIYGLNLSAGNRESFISFASTALGAARRMVSLANGERLRNKHGKEYTPPLFYRTYEFNTAISSNNEGEWSTWVITRGMTVPDLSDYKNLLTRALKFRDSIIAGIVAADLNSSATDDPSQIDAKSERISGDATADNAVRM